MPQKTRRFKCNGCASGIVRLIEKSTKLSCSFDVKDCDKCRKGFGLTSIQTLEEIKLYPSGQVKQWKAKAEKWDALEAKISAFYVDPDGYDVAEGDLGDIGEVAASAFGYL